MTSHLFRKLKSIENKISYHKCRLQLRYNVTSQNDIEISFSRQPLKFSVGKMAKMADGCCIANLGDTSVMATAVSSRKKSSAMSFVPLQVDYRQKAAAAGRIPTNHRRREFGQSEKEILTSRVIDRSIRPLFPKGFSIETQISCNPIAIDRINDPDVVSINAASAALALSEIPWNGPVSAVRVGLIDSKVVINPSRQDISRSSLNLIIAVTEQKQVVMLEGSAHHVNEDKFMEALETGIEESQSIIMAIKKLQEQFGRNKKLIEDPVFPSTEVLESATLLCEAKISEVFKDCSLDKVGRGIAIDAITQEALEKLKENYADCDPSILYEAINSVGKQTFRSLILETGIRCDGRNLKDLRHVSCEIDKFKPLHGCALFERGQTQVLCTVAFDSVEAALHNDPLFENPGEGDKNFMLHYEFPPYATNEIGRVGMYGRREVGHGALAEKSIRPVIPSEFPFTIRLTSEVLASNGSSSMATVCGGSLALMDAGVPISEPVAGLAMGLISVPDTENESKIADYRILTDILGLEDYLGDMDFKIAGSKNGITALQLDVKVPGLPLNVIQDSLIQAAAGRTKILDIMNETIAKPREEKKSNWPISENLEVPIHKLSHFIGLGGINLKQIRSKTGVQLTHRENGIFSVFAPNSEAMLEAKEIMDKLLHEEKIPELIYGAIYSARIVEIRDSGVMVTLYPMMKPTLIKNSMLDHKKVKHPSALGLEVGQEILVKYFGRDPEDGKMRLSRSALKTPLSQIVRNHSGDDQASTANNLR